MKPSPAERVRTLACGRLPGVLQVAGQDARLPVRHSTDAAGRPLVLARDGDELSRALRQWDGRGDPVVALSVADVPPVGGAPALGSAQIAGRIHRLDAADAAAVVQEFARSNPDAELLDVGRGVSMLLVEVDQVRLDDAMATHDIHVAEYATAEPDPLHELERDLLLDLADHHTVRVERYFRFLLAVAGVPCCPRPPRAVRLDRYGFVVDTGGVGTGGVGTGGVGTGGVGTGGSADRWVRLEFSRPVHCRHELARLLHPVLFHRGPCPRDR